jgi:hypothetical protein
VTGYTYYLYLSIERVSGNLFIYIVIWRSNAGIVKSEQSLLLGNGSVNTFPLQRIRKQQSSKSVAMQWRCNHAFPTIETMCFLLGSCKVVIEKGSVEKNWVEFRDASLPGYELGSRGIQLSRQLQNNGMKGISLWKEDFMCDLKWQWDCYKSVAWMRLVKTENTSACVTVNCKLCRSAIALYCL